MRPLFALMTTPNGSSQGVSLGRAVAKVAETKEDRT